MATQFQFRNAIWFRAPMRLIVLLVSVFALMSLYPALFDGANPDQARAVIGLAVLATFVILAVTFMVSMNDSFIDVEGGHVRIRFESFFHAHFPVEDIVAVRLIDPRPRFRYLWGLSTNFRDRVACSHGGRPVEIELARPCKVRLWPRTLAVRRFWLAVRDAGAFMEALEQARGEAAMYALPDPPALPRVA